MKTLIGSAQLALLDSTTKYSPGGDAFKITKMVRDAVRAQHFYLPPNGDLMGDPDYGYTMKGLPVRLPFSTITASVEFASSDVVVVGQECNRQLTESGGLEPVIECRSAFRIDGVWVVNPILGTILTEACTRGDVEPFMLSPFLSDAASMDRETLRDLRLYALTASSTVFNLIAALACENVVFESEGTSDPVKAIKSLSKRKEPKYATKLLKLLTPIPRAVKLSDGILLDSTDAKIFEDDEYCRAGPKQHLRRGHIRTLPSGRRIWVNECVVGDSDSGVLTKRYRISNDPSAPIATT